MIIDDLQDRGLVCIKRTISSISLLLDICTIIYYYFLHEGDNWHY
jgi:hypothetical protein